MHAQQHPAFCRFEVTIEFLNGDTVYGTERYVIEAADADEAQRLALERSENSLYDDARIPDRQRRTLVTADCDE